MIIKFMKTMKIAHRRTNTDMSIFTGVRENIGVIAQKSPFNRDYQRDDVTLAFLQPVI